MIRRGRVRLALHNGVARTNDGHGATAYHGNGFSQAAITGAHCHVELVAQDGGFLPKATKRYISDVVGHDLPY